jgi:short-subunit dehydrogenase
MKYAITGHTRGIGKRAFERLTPNVIGFSKSTGYDITNFADRRRIIDESSNCDIFINNATEGFGQTLLFLELLEAWKDTDKTIIKLLFDQHHTFEDRVIREQFSF